MGLIIFVHGFASNPDTTWQARRKASSGKVSPDAHDEPGNFVNWVRDLLPGDIPEELQQNVRLFFFNYDSYWMRDSVNMRLMSIAADLLDRIDVDIRLTERDKSRGLVFVGSSFGGLVVKQALVSAAIQSQHKHVVQHTKGVLFLGTPHRGSDGSYIGWLVAQALRPLGSSVFLLGLLEYDSPVLLDLHRDFVNIIGHDCRIINVYELLKSQVFGLKNFGWKKLWVKEASATFHGNGVINIAFRTNHFGLNKFSDKDENYKTLCSQLVRILKGGIKTTERLYAVPLKPVNTYTERHELQQKIEQGLQIRHENRSIPHAVAIIGMAGTGKSQLALNFAETHKEQYNPILWIDATSEETVRSSFQRCARALQLKEAAPGESGTATSLYNTASIQRVLEWLSKKAAVGHNDPWLVIVDNADDLTWGIEHVLPSGEHGSIILTSQNNNWLKKQKDVEHVRVDVLTPPEASSLLLRHLDMDSITAPEHIQKLCGTVAETLGYLALAVDLAGYHIANEDEAEVGITQYLADLNSNRDELLKSTVFQELLPTQKTVWTAWDLTLEKLDKHHGNAQARLLLTWLAHFDGTVIHYDIFNLIANEFAILLDPFESQFAKDMPAGLRQFFVLHQGEWKRDRCRSAFKLLARYGLLQEVPGILPGVTMHKLVRWRALQDAKDKPWSLWFLTALDAAGRQILDIFAPRMLDQTFAAQLPNLRDTLEGIQKAAEVYNYVIGYGLFEILSSQTRFDEAKEHRSSLGKGS
ncbi:hypothetical protein SBRCBS47491_009829 [Sporothrix bragantina]|uniref:NB-ARC domain-containing protein n=1 Tax=Sporothrix bragantina TaxID=671064 RepID=A0ABP0CXZ2_9PEZI